MRKIILGLTIITGALLLVLTYGEAEVLSYIAPPGPQAEAVANDTITEPTDSQEVPVEEVQDVVPEPPIIPDPDPVQEEPVQKEVEQVGLSEKKIMQLIKEKQTKVVEDPTSLLVLVNKEYSLPASYIPPDLVKPNVPFSFEGENEKQYLRKEAALALEELIGKAKEDGHAIYAVSGYRSYERQKAIFVRNAQNKGFKKANTFSAIPGESEHQTGLAMDVSSASVNFRLVESLGETPEGIWLKDNAHNFGFILRYPSDKVEITKYQYEPWHLRYVGVDTATAIKTMGVTLEEYLL